MGPNRGLFVQIVEDIPAQIPAQISPRLLIGRGWRALHSCNKLPWHRTILLYFRMISSSPCLVGVWVLLSPYSFRDINVSIIAMGSALISIQWKFILKKHSPKVQHIGRKGTLKRAPWGQPEDSAWHGGMHKLCRGLLVSGQGQYKIFSRCLSGSAELQPKGICCLIHPELWLCPCTSGILWKIRSVLLKDLGNACKEEIYGFIPCSQVLALMISLKKKILFQSFIKTFGLQ